MMRKLLILAFLVGPVHAAPFLVSDPDTTGGADKCVYQNGTSPPVETPVAVVPPSNLIGSCKIDLVNFPDGASNLQVWFRSTLWGVDSAKVAFTVRKPVAGGTGPANLRIVP